MEEIYNGNLVGSINGTIVGGAELVKGKKDLALRTNGENQYVDFGYQGDTCLGYFMLCTHGWVAAVWVQSANSTQAGVIMDTGRSANRGVWIILRKGRLEAQFIIGSNDSSISTTFTVEQVWFHVVVTWQPQYGAKLYVNGVLVDSDETDLSMHDTQFTDNLNVIVGAGSWYVRKFDGLLDELRVWDTVMSDEEVMILYAVDVGCI